MSDVLVVGGSGPTGPHVVNGLLERGHDVTVFHSGQHEVEFSAPVRHIHGDPHFEETIAEALGGERFDTAIIQYGRLRYLAAALAGRVAHVIAVGSATGILAGDDATVWGDLGRPAIVPESLLTDVDGTYLEMDPSRRFGFRVAETYRALFDHAAKGAFVATYIGYPILHGPNQPGCREWSIVRRAVDRRPFIVLGDGGRKLESRGFAANVAQAPLLALDHPEVSAGKTYIVSDRFVYTHRKRVEVVAAHLGCELEIVDLPFDLAWPCHPLYGGQREHRVTSSERIRLELGYQDKVDAREALLKTVEWLLEVRPAPGGELETQLGDPFAYELEDQLVAAWRRSRPAMEAVASPLGPYAHPYRHPRQPFETSWARPTSYFDLKK